MIKHVSTFFYNKPTTLHIRGVRLQSQITLKKRSSKTREIIQSVKRVILYINKLTDSYSGKRLQLLTRSIERFCAINYTIIKFN